MAQTYQDTNVNSLTINMLNKTEYDNLPQVSESELWLVEESLDSTVTQGSTNPVQSGAVYDAIQDIGGTINDGTTIFAKNQEIIGTTSANQSANQTIKLPNDVVMCKILENRALASYATPITRFKYIEDHGWVDMDRSGIQYNEGTGEWAGTFVSLDITEGEYYYDMDNKAVFVADENSEMQDVTSTVVIQDDINKLYCDVDTNQLYRYDGSNFVAIEDTSKAPNYPTFSTAATRENLLGNGESTTTLWGKVKKYFTDLKAVAFTDSYNDLTDKPQNATTTTAGLMSADDKKKVDTIGIVYRGQLQHNLTVMKSGSNLIHVHCQDFENDNCCLDCYVAARGTTGSASTFTWHYIYIIRDQTKLDIQCNYNGLINVINNTGRADSDFILFIDKLI